MKTKDILGAIEYICSNSDKEWVTLDIMKNRPVSNRERALAKALDVIYCLTHCQGSCKHPDWEKQNEKLIKELKKRGELI